MFKKVVFAIQIASIVCAFNKKIPSLNVTVDESHIFVFDDVLQPNVGKAFRFYLGMNKYSYLYPDPHEHQQNQNKTEGNLYWKAPINPSTLIKTRFWKHIRDAYKSLPNERTKEQKFLPYEAYGTALHRGDSPVVFRGDEDTKGKIFVRIFLTPGLGKHSYSDQAFYNKNDEIAVSVYPKTYRVVLWTGNIQTLFHPPSMGFLNHEYSFFIKLTNDMNLFQKRSMQFDERKKLEDHFEEQPFPLSNMINTFDFNKINISQHVLGKYYDRNGDVIAFFDGVFPKELLTTLRTYFLSYKGLFRSSEYDISPQETNDNVKWIASIQPEKLVNTPYMELIKRLAAFLSNTTDWHPYDVSCNFIQHAHHTRIHTDCTNNEYEYTFLLYLNPDWDENMYAETSFYQYNQDTLKLVEKVGLETVNGEGLENYDFLAAAIPKFGRVALFRNLIPHSARPPAPSFLAARYTFPVKISETRAIARAKMLRELLEVDEEDGKDPDFESLKNGNYEPFLVEEKREFVEQNIQRLRHLIDQHQKEHKEKVTNMLFPQHLKPTST